MIANGVDVHDVEVEIRVVRDPDGTYRLWINAPLCMLRAWRVPKLHLEGLALTEPAGEASRSMARTESLK
jgi:hypothetical protein